MAIKTFFFMMFVSLYLCGFSPLTGARGRLAASSDKEAWTTNHSMLVLDAGWRLPLRLRRRKVQPREAASQQAVA
jgi:hypothetical protein